MTFSRIKNTGWVVNEKVTSPQLNQLDLDHFNSLDKTGDNLTNAGGITGRVDVVTGGGELDIQTGGVFHVKSGSTFTIDTGSDATLTGAKYDDVHLNLTSYSSGPQTLSATTGVVILVDTTSAAITLTLPASQDGRVFVIKDVAGTAGTNNITIATPGSEKIENLTNNYVMDAAFQCVELVADASSNWWFKGGV